MRDVLRPASETELAEAIAAAAAPLEIIGSGSKRGWGQPVEAAQFLDLSAFDQVHAYEPEELILEAGAGARLSDLEALIDARGQQLAFEPPDFSRLMGSNSAGTLGGMLCCNLAGPRRIKSGAARDHVLGVRGVSGRGEVFKAGARVVKNVTGYDVPKVMAHSFGTLAALTSITMKVLPKPETEETLVLGGLDDIAAVAAMSTAMGSPCEVSGAAHVPGEGTFLRLEGIAASVAARRDSLAKLLARPVQILAGRASNHLWRGIRDVVRLTDSAARPVWRVSLTPSDAPQFVATIRARLDVRYHFDWAGGLVWLDVPPADDAGAAIIRGALNAGHATLLRAPDTVRTALEVFQPLPPALAALTRRVKSSFDPRGILNPGRMYRGL